MKESALQLFQKWLQQGLLRKVITYIAIIGACRWGNVTERALQLFQLIQQKGLQPNMITYNDLIRACDKW